MHTGVAVGAAVPYRIKPPYLLLELEEFLKVRADFNQGWVHLAFQKCLEGNNIMNCFDTTGM